MKAKKLFPFIILMIPFLCFSWGEKGHKLVAKFAKASLSKSIIDSVQFYLGKMSFLEASVWMDAVRSDHHYDYLKPWHYVNVPKDSAYSKTQNPNVINSIGKAIGELKNRKGKSKEEIKFQLLVLFHLMGDIHQPLHCGYGEDKGGNTMDVDCNGAYTNLHKVWDTEIIEISHIKLKDCLALSNKLSWEEKKAAMSPDIESWVRESRSYLDNIYDFNKALITREYIEKNKQLVEKRLVFAGIRLSMILHQLFS